MVYNEKFQINIQGYDNIEFYYSFNESSTFEDLLEYLAYIIPKANICLHSKFKSGRNNYDFNRYEIGLDQKICDCKKFKNLFLEINKHCKCDNSLLKYSKNDLIQKFMIEINNLKNFKKENSSLKDEIISLKKGKKQLEMALNGDLEKISLLGQYGYDVNGIKMKDNVIKIDPKTNQLIGNEINDKPEFKNFYDVIVHINSIKEINKGWNVEMSPKGKENYEKYKSEKIIKIGIIGNSNKGKSFLLSKISKINLPSGTSIRTEGLSIKYPDLGEFKNRKIALLDSAGLETPVLKDSNIKDEKINEFFKEKSREKLITELFLQNYIINNSDVLISVVGILTYSEQKLLMKIKKEIKNSKLKIPLFIIHNLITFTNICQVNDYINEYLFNSATFSLVEGHKVSTSTETKKGRYFYETNKDMIIYHLIFANEGSEAGKFFNQFTLDFLENHYQNVTHLEPFDVIETIKDRYIKLSKDFIEKSLEEKIDKESFDNSDPQSIKLKDTKEIILKKCLTDELGFSNLKANGFEPTYNLFKKDNCIILRIEASGNTNLYPPDIEFAGEYNIIKIKGEKKKDKEPANIDDNIINKREIGKFSFEIPLKAEDYLLSNENAEISQNKGLIIIQFKLAQKIKMKGIEVTEDEEI